MLFSAMEEKLDEDELNGDTSTEYRIRKTQHSTLMRKFVDVMTNYNKTQMDFRERCKDKLYRQLEIGIVPKNS